MKDPLVMAAHETHGIAASISMMTRIQTKPDALRIGLGEKSFNLIFKLDMSLSVGMKGNLKAETIPYDIGYFMSGFDQSLPSVAIEAYRRERFARIQVGI